MFCKHCGKGIDDKALVCPFCGVAQAKMVVADEGKKPINGLGIAGFVVSLLSLWLGVYFCIASIVGLVLSIIGMASSAKHSSNGFAVAGLVIGIISVFIWGLVWLIVGTAIIGLTA